MRAYIKLLDGYPILADQLADFVREQLRLLYAVITTVEWYWDEPDADTPVEYGVWIEVGNTPLEEYGPILVHITRNCFQRFGDVELQLPPKTT